MSPWIAGFLIFFGYPLVWSAYLSLTHYDLLSPPRWVGLANYRFLFSSDQTFWPAVKNTLWFLAIAVPLQVLFAFCIALLLQRARRGVGVFRTVFYLPALAPPVAATLAFVYLLNPATGPGQHLPFEARHRGPALVRLALVGEAVADAARDLGRREHDDHLPRGDRRRAASTSTSRPRSTARARCRGSST